MAREGSRRGAAGAAAMATALVTLLAGCGSSGGSDAASPGPSRPASTGSTSATPAPSPPASTPTTPPPTTSPPTHPPTTSAPPVPTTSPTTQAEPPAPPPTSPPPAPPADETLRPGDSGAAVLALQQRLTELGYWLGSPDGDFGTLTTQAVLALQGTAGIARDGKVGPRTRAELEAGTRPAARSTSGTVTEIDLDHGVILFVRDGTVHRVLHTSTGTFQKYTHEGRTMLADTPRGRWSVSWAQNGWRDGELGRLYRPRYFHRDGVAVHGYPSVPAYPASHGCARVTMAAMDMIWSQGLMPKGTAVWVY